MALPVHSCKCRQTARLFDPAARWPVPTSRIGWSGLVSIRLFKYLDAGFITVHDWTFQQPVAHLIQQRLQVLSELDNPTCEGLTRGIDTVSTQHRLEKMPRRSGKKL